MAVVDFSSISESLASIFKDEISKQFNRSAAFPRFFEEDVIRTVAEEEPADAAITPTRPVRTVGWDVSFARQMANAAAQVDGVTDVHVTDVRLDGDNIVVNMNVRPARSVEMLTLDLEVGDPWATRTIVE